MLGPIMFADRARCRRLFFGDFFLGFCDSGQAFPLLLHNEQATQEDSDHYYN